MKSTISIRKKKLSADRKIPFPKKNHSPAKFGNAKFQQSFPIVAIGASAGGFEAVTQLLLNLPSDTGMSFIYVQHLSPDYKSMLVSLLSKSTKMKVHQAKNMMDLLPNNFYVIPPDRELVVIDGKIILNPRKKGINLPIDALFRSLAEKHGEDAIGIILSGNASDGTMGLKAIKNRGGLTFAQDESAKFNSMPNSAIVEGAVDFVLSPKEIAHKLVQISRQPLFIHHVIPENPDGEPDNCLPDFRIILHILQKETGVDFRLYKSNTIMRRILRRMLLQKIKTAKQYTRLLLRNRTELNLLYHDLLINVTNFFRDTEVFHYLKSTLFPKLLKNKKEGESFRIWVPACSTGEEVYSIAMLLFDIQGNKPGKVPIQIFATDLSEKAVNKARIGEYSAKELELVPAGYLKRFFVKSNGNYRIEQAIRDICVFAPHNILHDPPFSRLDFISCRNLLIYFDNMAQKKALSTFHYALNDNGHLLLGNSETTGISQGLFNEVHKKFKIYSRKKDTRAQTDVWEIRPRFSDIIPKETNQDIVQKGIPVNFKNLESAIDSILLSRYVPASAVINHDMEILQFRGSTSQFLEHTSGRANLNILKMIRPEIAFELRNSIHKAIKQNRPVLKTGIELKINSHFQSISLKVVPLDIDWHEPLLLILFSEQARVEQFISPGGEKNNLAFKRKIKKLEEEITAYRDDLRAITENHEATIEELQSANEEIVSSNEELRTVNEELQTSKEEIQSTNEELATVNRELLTRNELLFESQGYSEAIIATLHEPIIVLDKEFRAKTANRAFYKKFKLSPEKTEGTLLFDLSNKQWNFPRLRILLKAMVLKNSFLQNVEIEHEFPGVGKKILLLNANRIEQKGDLLILLAISDITELVNKRNEVIRIQNNHRKELEAKNKILSEKNIELEKINKELESFSYISSHDLQEPLRKIRNFVDILLQEEHKYLSGHGKDYLLKMQECSLRMQNLIEDLLRYSRIKNDKHIFEETDFSALFEKVKEDFSEELHEKKARINFSSKSCLIKIIPCQFKQLMSNLISNALKFSNPKKQIHINIKCEIANADKLNNRKLQQGKKYIHILFADNGIGFDPQYRDRIFGVFQRLHPLDQYKGSGIGLAMCKRIVENHQGIITATGKINKGARFDIYIPHG